MDRSALGDGANEFLDPFGHELHPTPATTTPAWSGPEPGWSAPTPAPAPRGSRRGWLIGGLVAGGVVLLALIAVAVFVVGRASTGPVIDEDFSSGPGPFSTDSDNFVDLTVVDDAYQVTLKDVDSPQEARSFFDPARSAITVTAKVSETEAPAASAAGISCYSNTETGYLLVVSSDGEWAIVKVIDLNEGTTDVLAEGTSETGLSSQAITLHLSCTGGGTDPTVITGQVDDGPVHTADDDEGYDQFRAAGFFAAAEEAPSILVFDDMVVEDAS